MQLRTESMQVRRAVVCAQGSDGSKSVYWHPALRQPEIHDTTRSQGDCEDILRQCRGHAKHALPEHVGNRALDPHPDSRNYGAAQCWFCIIAAPVEENLLQSFPDGIPEFTSRGFCSGVRHPTFETVGVTGGPAKNRRRPPG